MKKYLITSAQSCVSPHPVFWEGLLNYAKINNAELIVLPLHGQQASEDYDRIYEVFKPYLETGKRMLNSNIKIEQFHVQPQNIDPTTSQKRFAQRSTSLIFASPKQRVVPIVHSSKKFPKLLLTTGACTRPNYASGMDANAERRRRGSIALRDHEYGALVVEIRDNQTFHHRNILADTRGKFVDLGTLYNGKTTSEAILDAMVLGDWHSGQTDPIIKDVTLNMIKQLNPNRVFLHDFFDGHSCSHWVEKRNVRWKLIQQYDKGHHVLERELKGCLADLKLIDKAAKGKPIIVVNSNHHDFLPRYLEEIRFNRDMTNYRLAIKILDHFAEKDYNDCVQFGISLMGKIPSAVKFLKEDEDYKVRGYHLGSHGHKRGTFSSFGSINQTETAFGPSISGHCHRSQKLRRTYTVGTMLPRDVYYMRGHPSSFTHTHALLWNTGTVQLINIFDGKWRGSK